ncbi:MAG: efflux RND transporter periplasmic adaptor subunit [Crocinitomicaceae bacterium]
MKRTIINITIMLLVFGVSSCGEQAKESHDEHAGDEQGHSENTVEMTQAQFNNAEIKIAQIEKRNLSDLLIINGLVDAPPQNLISVSAPLGGYVVSTDLVAGMYVKKGQKLLTIEHQDYIQLQQDFLDKKSQLEYLESDFKRQEKLRTENVNSEKSFQQISSQYKSMKAQVTGLKEKLAYIGINSSSLTENNITRRVTIKAPTSGFVSIMNVNIGKYCNPTDVLIELIDTEHLHAELTVFEKDLGKVKIGQKVRLNIPGSSGEEVMASIYLIGKAINKDRSVKIHAHFDKENKDLVPGMYVNGSISIENNDVFAVNTPSVLTFDGHDYIVLSEGTEMEKGVKMHHFELKEVIKGVSESGYTEISFVENIDATKVQYVSNGAFSILAMLKNKEDEGGHGH